MNSLKLPQNPVDAARVRARRLVETTHSRDPFLIAKLLDVDILNVPGCKKQRGAFYVILDQAFIFLSTRLTELEMKLVCAHELGHAVLHKQLAAEKPLCEYDLFLRENDTEHEADAFASEILLDTREVRESIDSGMDIYECARALGTDVRLLQVKLEGMKQLKNRL